MSGGDEDMRLWNQIEVEGQMYSALQGPSAYSTQKPYCQAIGP
jgi:hypothetical protein